MSKNTSTSLAAPGGTYQASDAPGPLTASDMGGQLTVQYKRAVSGMREVLIFGAMLKQVENSLSNVDTLSVRGRPQTGHGLAGGGLKGWLEAHAPEISRPTALRFLGVTEAIALEYMQIVGAAVAQAYDLPALVLADASTLDAHAALKQSELFDYVSGTSQRSWLDRYKSPDAGGEQPRPRLDQCQSSAGGANACPPPRLKPDAALSAEEEFNLVHARLKKDASELFSALEIYAERGHYQALNDAELDTGLMMLTEARAKMEAWRRTPKGKRLADAVQKEIRLWKGVK